jgi:hypothetical protein
MIEIDHYGERLALGLGDAMLPMQLLDGAYFHFYK